MNVICGVRLLNIFRIPVIPFMRDEHEMRISVNLTMDPKLVETIDNLRGREKRSTFIEHLLRIGLKVYLKEEKHA